ncbi:hypothetical protein D9Q98_001132 [Chlorella vulgaris]|uniref:membrane dipeptidase n=1 Tax=Chlorella vulgaris TaxID=3077 RepID=A0A9D4Z2Q7_CHLVU|nr:hypothetical protein D9Q98_001132 [Chlorella vulgaris]
MGTAAVQRRRRAALVSTCLVLALATISTAQACTSYIVAAHASTDGSVLIGRNDDGEGAVAPNWLVHHPARDGPAPFTANLNSLTLLLPGPGLAYFSLPSGPLADPSSGRNTTGEAAGWNSAGVAVSATESIYNSAAALAADPFNEVDGIIEDAIPSLLLPQATSARHAVQLLGDLVTQRGAGEAFGVLAGDAEEAWYLETGSGHHWLAQRVPRRQYFVSANQGRLQEADLGDTSSTLSSPGLLRFAEEAGLWDPHSGRPFNFFSTFMRDGPQDTDYSHPRLCLLHRLWGSLPTASACANIRKLPTFAQPWPRTLGVRDVKAAMRNHWDGSSHDPYLHQHPDEPWRPIALLRTSMAHVTQLRPLSANLPDALSIITHVSLATPKLAPFIPLYKGLPPHALPPELTAAKERRPDGVSLFWRARRLQALVFRDWKRLAGPAATAIVAFERRLEERDLPKFERSTYARAVDKGGEAGGERALAALTAHVCQQAGKLLDRLAADAADALGLPGVPSDQDMLEMLEEAAEAYSFEPAESSSSGRGVRYAAAGIGLAGGGGGGSSIAAS